jgi:hypothetical protein
MSQPCTNVSFLCHQVRPILCLMDDPIVFLSLSHLVTLMWSWLFLICTDLSGAVRLAQCPRVAAKLKNSYLKQLHNSWMRRCVVFYYVLINFLLHFSTPLLHFFQVETNLHIFCFLQSAQNLYYVNGLMCKVHIDRGHIGVPSPSE